MRSIQPQARWQHRSTALISINIGTTDVEGYDLTIGYRLPEQSWGRLSFVLDSTYTSHYELNDDGDDLVGEYANRLNFWRVRSNLLAR